MSKNEMTGAAIIVRALIDQGVEAVFGYPGGAVLPIYDEIFKQNHLKHYLGRQEGGCLHAAEGYARSTGKVGVALVTSGPGATNAVTGLTDALMDSIPIVCLTGQVPTHLIGNDAFQEADTTGITRPCTKHNYLVKDIADLPRVMHEAFHVASSGRPGPVVIDLPKDIQFADGIYQGPEAFDHRSYKPKTDPSTEKLDEALRLMANAKRPLFYVGGGVINAGGEASEDLVKLVRATGFPITQTLMGLGAFPTDDKQSLGMVGMHGLYESNMAMHDCDLMIGIGVRFDDRVTGRLDAFSPGSTKIQIDIDPSSVNKNVRVDLPIVGDAGKAIDYLLKGWRAKKMKADGAALDLWWKVVNKWREKRCLSYTPDKTIIKPQAGAGAPAGRDGKGRARILRDDRSWPTPDVGGAISAIPPATPLDDLGRPRHHGLWLARCYRRASGASRRARGRCIGRGIIHDEHAGNVLHRAVQAACEAVHPEQSVDGHGAPMAGIAARCALF